MFPIQHKLFLALLKNYTCGISLTESSLMLPVKSVSGIIGLGKTESV
jgi:cobalamin-dependent methionine synthase I